MAHSASTQVQLQSRPERRSPGGHVSIDRYRQTACRRRTARPWLRFIAGSIVALAIGECLLRSIATPRGGDAISNGSEIRSYGEGIATSHFSKSGERLTGNPPVAAAASAVILGNSYVEALQLPDSSTMGSVLERISRAAGRPLNVHQFGWSGESIPQYLGFVDRVEREHPSWVSVMVHKYDLCTMPLQPGPRGLSVSITPDLSLILHKTPPAVSFLQKALQGVMNHSALLTAAIRRAVDAVNVSSPTAQTCEPRLPAASVRSLKKAYGKNLLVVYIADVGIPADPQPDPLELALLKACKEAAVTCLSTREPMVDEFTRRSAVARGFHNTVIGAGHLNELGHRLVAHQIWETVSKEN